MTLSQRSGCFLAPPWMLFRFQKYITVLAKMKEARSPSETIISSQIAPVAVQILAALVTALLVAWAQSACSD